MRGILSGTIFLTCTCMFALSYRTQAYRGLVTFGENDVEVDMNSFINQGYTILRNALPRSVIDDMSAKVTSYKDNKGSRCHPWHNGHTIVDFVTDPYLADVYEAVHTNSKIQSALQQILGTSLGTGKSQYRYVGHNNINIGGRSGWHKDRLNGIFRAYEQHSPWDVVDGNQMKIVKVAVYFDDHSPADDLDSLRVVPGSHNIRDIPKEKHNVTFLHPAKGDVLIFDQRVTHRGQGPLGETDYLAPGQVNGTDLPELKIKPRIMLQVGYGLNNLFSDEFEQGTRMRQELRNTPECDVDKDCVARKVKEDLVKKGIVLPSDMIKDFATQFPGIF